MKLAAVHVKRPSFAAMEAAYPGHAQSREDLYRELGIEALLNNAAFMNTCGIRMSYALARAGSPLHKGGLKINKGPHQGARLEPNMRKLAEQLEDVLGPPQKFDGDAAAKEALVMQQGIVAFFFGEFLPLVGAQGHIDLLRPKQSGFLNCVGTCYFGPNNKVWFWALP